MQPAPAQPNLWRPSCRVLTGERPAGMVRKIGRGVVRDLSGCLVQGRWRPGDGSKRANSVAISATLPLQSTCGANARRGVQQQRRPRRREERKRAGSAWGSAPRRALGRRGRLRPPPLGP